MHETLVVMSSFFRSAGDISSSGYTETSNTDDDHSDVGEALTRVHTIGSSENSNGGTFGPAASTQRHRDVLLHALLEDRCLREALEELNATSADGFYDQSHPDVKARANEKYSELCRTLRPYGLVAPGLDAPHHQELRGKYRDGLNLISQASAGAAVQQDPAFEAQLSVPPSLRRLLAHSAHPNDASIDIPFRNLSLAPALSTVPPFLADLTSSHPLLDSTRYRRDFDEYGILGKGGYGTVYHVKHKLDNLPYAVKKIPLSSTRLLRIQNRGEDELDNILMELRTLARLEHPNIVRYFSGWIEWSQPSMPELTASSRNERLLMAPGDESSEQSAVLGAQDPLSLSVGQDILFEDSRATASNGSTNSAPLGRVRTRSTLASVSDEEEVEVIQRFEDPTSSMLTQSLGEHELHSTEPVLTLHIQMSLYSMTLSNYISSTSVDDAASLSALRHCFHLRQSLRMLLSILGGVEYLHDEGIVHRDLKPGNIFLAIRLSSPPGTIPLSSCTDCRDAISEDEKPFSIGLCIGDFGLVSAIAQPELAPSATSPGKAVGTEIYRPESVSSAAHPCLDIFALGIVAFELLWKFGTRMERVDTLHKLRKGEFPSNFEEKVGDEDGRVKELIASLVAMKEEDRPSCKKVRSTVLSILKGMNTG